MSGRLIFLQIVRASVRCYRWILRLDDFHYIFYLYNEHSGVFGACVCVCDLPNGTVIL